MNDLSANALAQVYASASREFQGKLLQPFGHHFLYTTLTGRVLKMGQSWLQTQPKIAFLKKQTHARPVKLITPNLENLDNNVSLESLHVGPPSAPFFHSKLWLGTAKHAGFASVPGPGAAVSLLPGVSAMRFLQRARHGASPSGRFAAGGASPAVLWLRGAPPSSTHGPNEEANAVMTPPWWMEKRETFPYKNGRPPHGLLSNKHILKNGKRYRIHIPCFAAPFFWTSPPRFACSEKVVFSIAIAVDDTDSCRASPYVAFPKIARAAAFVARSTDTSAAPSSGLLCHLCPPIETSLWYHFESVASDWIDCHEQLSLSWSASFQCLYSNPVWKPKATLLESEVIIYSKTSSVGVLHSYYLCNPSFIIQIQQD